MISAKKYFKEVLEEYKRITFPKWNEVYVTSIYISVIIVFTTIAIVLADYFISQVIKIIFGIGE